MTTSKPTRKTTKSIGEQAKDFAGDYTPHPLTKAARTLVNAKSCLSETNTRLQKLRDGNEHRKQI